MILFFSGFAVGAIVALFTLVAIASVYRAYSSSVDDKNFEEWQSEWMS